MATKQIKSHLLLDGEITAKKIIKELGTNSQFLMADGSTKEYFEHALKHIQIAASDEETALTTGVAKTTFRLPHSLNINEARASLTTAPTGSKLIVNVNSNGASVFSTKLSIDIGEKTSFTASIPAVITGTTIPDDTEITIDIDQVGSTIAGVGLKITLIGYEAPPV